MAKRKVKSICKHVEEHKCLTDSFLNDMDCQSLGLLLLHLHLQTLRTREFLVSQAKEIAKILSPYSFLEKYSDRFPELYWKEN